MQNTHSPLARFMLMFSVIFAAEIIFSLPYHVVRYFRPTVMEVFGLSNGGLGDIFAMYGIMAMLSYFPGGLLADRFSPRRLMSISLLATASGGLLFYQLPDHTTLAGLYAFWGVTTIFLFWAPLMRVVRIWGGKVSQGKAFGILDGGRGLASAVMASVAVVILSYAMPEQLDSMSDSQRSEALQSVILFYSCLTALAALPVWLTVPDSAGESAGESGGESAGESGGKPDKHSGDSARMSVSAAIRDVISQPVVWFQALIVLTAYCAFKGLDYYTIYATTVLGYNEVEASAAYSTVAYVRPVAAVTAGILADKFRTSRVFQWLFILLTLVFVLQANLSPGGWVTGLIYVNIVLTFFAVNAARGIYFAMLEESKVSGHLTGTSVGLISLLGYTPDVFFAPVAGRILDAAPGIEGFHHYFALLAMVGVLGLAATLALARQIKKAANSQGSTAKEPLDSAP